VRNDGTHDLVEIVIDANFDIGKLPERSLECLYITR
jgi:hypothetical protein